MDLRRRRQPHRLHGFPGQQLHPGDGAALRPGQGRQLPVRDQRWPAFPGPQRPGRSWRQERGQAGGAGPRCRLRPDRDACRPAAARREIRAVRLRRRRYRGGKLGLHRALQLRLQPQRGGQGRPRHARSRRLRLGIAASPVSRQGAQRGVLPAHGQRRLRRVGQPDLPLRAQLQRRQAARHRRERASPHRRRLHPARTTRRMA